jgi:hypothetical protein
MIRNINLKTTDTHIKFNIVKEAGYEIKTITNEDTKRRKLILTDRNGNDLNKYFDNIFNNIDEVINLLQDQLHCRVVA